MLVRAPRTADALWSAEQMLSDASGFVMARIQAFEPNFSGIATDSS
ncbi:hypothetical protein SBC2_09450 [Caballeronia sp. SBC2]|nr:hypothetical protein SBC2_09450 [Caballeronia sp. SBC2]